ncbi:MAG: glycosyltransferase [Microbacteriaceae bacterium]|nr:glycosyltransferase [Microbacteriaceae bacterium]
MTSHKPTMLILTKTSLDKEPRALRQIKFFANDYEVTTMGYGDSPVKGVNHIQLPDGSKRSLISRIFDFGLNKIADLFKLYRLKPWSQSTNRWALKRITKQNWDVVIAHDVGTLALAASLKNKKLFISDMHEYAPRQYEHSKIWVKKVAPYNTWLCREYLPKANLVITVSSGLAKEFNANFKIDSQVIISASPFHELEPKLTTNPIKLVHSGIAAPARQIEIMIEAVNMSKSDVTLDLYLVRNEDSGYVDQLNDLILDKSKIRIHQAVSYEKLIPTLNNFDVGISLIAPTTFNHLHSLPNKVFDYVQARLCIVVGPSPDMQSLIQEHKLGYITKDFTAAALAEVINNLTHENVAKSKMNSHQKARELSGDTEMLKLSKMIDQKI